MKLKKDIDLKELVQAVKQCSYDVYYETREGDRLNLKSTLSEYIFAASAMDRGFLENGEVLCDEKNDYERIARFLEIDYS